MKKFDPEKITLKEYMDTAEKLCDLMDDQDCELCPFGDGSLNCEKSAIDSDTVKMVFEKLEELERGKDQYDEIIHDLYVLCRKRKETQNCSGCPLYAFRGCSLSFVQKILIEIKRWKNEQSTGD